MAATDYYFSNAGNDANPGTQASPKETIAELNSLNPDDGSNAYFNRGDTFDDVLLTVDWSGLSEGNESVVGMYGSGAKPKFRYNTLPEVIQVAANKNHLSVEDLDTLNTQTASGRSVQCTGGGNTNITFQRLNVDSEHHGIYVKLIDGYNILDCDVDARRHNIAIYADESASQAAQIKNGVVTGNTVTVGNNDSGDAIVLHDATTKTPNENHLFANNTGSGADENIMDIGGGASDVTVELNDFSGSGKPILTCGHGASDVKIRRNIIKDHAATTGTNFFNLGASSAAELCSDFDVYDNLIYGTTAGSTTVDGVHINAYLAGLRFIHNLIDMADSTGGSTACFRTNSSGPSATSVVVKNNIIFSNGNMYYVRFAESGFQPDNGEWAFDYNQYYGYTGGNEGFKYQDGGDATQYKTLAAWKADFGQDTNSPIEQLPGWTNRATHDYTIGAASNVNGEGIALSYTDFDDKDYTETAFDDPAPAIGPHEYVDGGDSTPPAFGGITSASQDNTGDVTANWSAATDAVTPQGSIVYNIYVAKTSGGQDFSSIDATVTGETSRTFAVSGYGLRYIVVRAKDQADNESTNTEESTVTLPKITSFRGQPSLRIH